MKLTDRRLYRSKSLQDFLFRLDFDENENTRRRTADREITALVGAGFVAPDVNKIFGCDISHWDGNVNLQLFQNFGGKFVIIKGMDGTIPTRYWRENTARAIEARLPNSSYAWLYPDRFVNCTLQAQAFHNLIKDTPHSFPPVIDFEWTRFAGTQANPNYEDLRKWLAAFIRIGGVKPILYSAAGYMNMFGRLPDDIREMLSGYMFASYGGTRPLYPFGFTEYDIWQFTASGDALTLAPGDRNKKELDLNYMTEEFYRRYNGEITTPEPEEPVTRYTATNLYPNMSLRNGHDTGAGAIKTFPALSKWYGDLVWTAPVDKFLENGTQVNRAGDVWLNVSNIGGVAYSGWVAITHLGKEYCKLDDSNPPAPEPTFPPEVGLTISGVTKVYVPKL
jgi:GH25 family lysozyme M1 (1,4-beta-N-acetylmuramidase)